MTRINGYRRNFPWEIVQRMPEWSSPPMCDVSTNPENLPRFLVTFPCLFLQCRLRLKLHKQNIAPSIATQAGRAKQVCSVSSVGCQRDAARICCWTQAPAAQCPQLSIDISCPQGALSSKPAACRCCCRFTVQTDGQTDRQMDGHKYVSDMNQMNRRRWSSSLGGVESCLEKMRLGAAGMNWMYHVNGSSPGWSSK